MLLTDYFLHLPRRRHEAVVSAEAISGAGFLGRLLDGAGGSEFIFECVLNRPEAEGDYSLRVTRRDLPGWLTALGCDRFASWSEGSVPWARVRDFFSRWESDPLFSKVGEFWFEFDYGALSTARPTPCCFFGVERVTSLEDLDGVRDGPLEALLGRTLTCGALEKLKRCMEALPSGTRLYQIGVMLGRDENPCSVRLFTGGMRADAVIPFLRSAGWDSQNSEPALEEFLLWSAPHSDGFYVIDFDVSDDNISCKLGVNFGVERQQTFEFLDALYGRGLILAEKREGVKSWLESDDIPSLKNDISHFKFPFDGTVSSGKAYLRHDGQGDPLENLSRW